jgi:hypothetical protein
MAPQACKVCPPYPWQTKADRWSLLAEPGFVTIR